MKRANISMRPTLAAVTSVLMLIAIVPMTLAGSDFAPAGEPSTQSRVGWTPNEGCPPNC